MDWLMVEKVTPQKPEIIAIAADLHAEPDAVFGKCFRLWAWADSHSITGSVPGMTAALVDSLIGLPGFANALEKVGWLVFQANGIELPNFQRHMGKSAKARALTAERVRRHRGKANDGDVTQMKRSCNAPSVTPVRGGRVTPIFSSLLSSSLSQEENDGGVGEERETKPRIDRPQKGVPWESFLAGEWCFWYAGTASSQREHEQLGKFFRSLISRNIPPDAILARIRDRKNRPTTEPTWEFEKFFQHGSRAQFSGIDDFERIAMEATRNGKH
jgi:hypothetical protein